MFTTPVYAQITNPALKDFTTPQEGGAGFAFYVAQLWKTVVVVGGIAFLLYLVWGGLEWLLSGGDKQKVEMAQKKITNAFIGLTFLVASFAVTLFFSTVLKIDLLNIDWTFGGR